MLSLPIEKAMDQKKNPPTTKPDPTATRPTLKTIAEITKLGTTTVSRALKDAPDIGEQTKKRVRTVAEQIGYTPNRAGVGLRTGKTNVINLVLSLDEEIMGLTSHIVRGLSETLSTTPYHLTVTPYTLGSSPLDAVRYIAETRSADGIILSRTEPNDARVEYLAKRNIPFATHGRTQMGIEHPFHDFDNEQFVINSIASLHAKNRSRIAVLGPTKNLTFYHHTLAGYNKGMQAHGLTPYPTLPFTIDNTLDTIEARTAKLFQQASPPDGIISMSGGSTIALCCGIEKAGFCLGNEVDIVSKQTVNILPRFRPQIETVHEDIQLAGRELARLVLASIHNTPATDLQSIVYTKTKRD